MPKKIPENQAIVFPEESVFLIEEMLKKYELYREPRERYAQMAEELKKVQSSQEKRKVIEAQLERKLAKIIREVAEEKIAREDFPAHLQQLFKLSSTTAKALAKDLEKNVLVFARKISIPEETVQPARSRLETSLPIAPVPKEFPKPEEPLGKVSPQKLKTTASQVDSSSSPKEESEIPSEEEPKKPDVYREPIEPNE